MVFVRSYVSFMCILRVLGRFLTGLFWLFFGCVMAKFDETEPITGEELAFIRMRYGWSLSRAANMLGTTRHYLRKVEAGDKPCKIIYAKRYENAMGSKWLRMIRKLYVEHKAKKPLAYVPGLNDDQFTGV